jgi:hypothetical protein
MVRRYVNIALAPGLTDLHRKFFSEGFHNSNLPHSSPDWGSDTLWVGFGFSGGMCGLHNVCCCCAGISNRDRSGKHEVCWQERGRTCSELPGPQALLKF